MKIVVCIKQVPDTKGGVKFNPDGTLDRGAMLTIMNPDDKACLLYTSIHVAEVNTFLYIIKNVGIYIICYDNVTFRFVFQI